MSISIAWNIVTSQAFDQHGDGSITLAASDSQQSEVQILPSSTPQHPSNRLSSTLPTGTCGSKGNQCCPAISILRSDGPAGSTQVRR